MECLAWETDRAEVSAVLGTLSAEFLVAAVVWSGDAWAAGNVMLGKE